MTEATAEEPSPYEPLKGTWMIKCLGKDQGTLQFTEPATFNLDADKGLQGLFGEPGFWDSYVTGCSQFAEPDFEPHIFEFVILKGKHFEGVFKIHSKYYCNRISTTLISGIMRFGDDEDKQYRLFVGRRIKK